MQEKGITPCIPGRKIRNKNVKYDKRRYKRRNRIEPPERLASRRDALLSMPEGLLLCRSPRRDRHLLALIDELTLI